MARDFIEKHLQNPGSNPLRVMVSGGGTGGHVFPAIAIADAVCRLLPDTEILFVGASGRMEMEKVPEAGYKIIGLWISGFQRRFTLENLLFPLKLIASLWKARSIIRSFKPDVAIGVGGYASGALLEMAVRMHIPALIQEQNSFPGVTNRILANRVNRICVAYKGMEKYFPAEKLVETGNPVRKGLFDKKITKEAGIAHFQLDPKKKTILVLGGSGGAKTINKAMEENDTYLSKKPNIQVIWQCGKFYFEDFKQTTTARLPNVRLLAFLDKIEMAYAAADMVICRAGALTIAELAAAGVPAILIPSPFVAGDHQSKNAEALKKEGAAFIVNDNEAASAIPLAHRMMDDEWRLKVLAENMKRSAKLLADEDIALEAIFLALTKNEER